MVGGSALFLVFGLTAVVATLAVLWVQRAARASRLTKRHPIGSSELGGGLAEQVGEWQRLGFGPVQASRSVENGMRSTLAVLTDPSRRFDVRIRATAAGDSSIETLDVISYFPAGKFVTSSMVGASLMPDEVVQTCFGGDGQRLVDLHVRALEALETAGAEPLDHDPGGALARHHTEAEGELAWLAGHPLRYLKATLGVASSLLHLREHAAPIRGRHRVSRIAGKLAGRHRGRLT